VNVELLARECHILSEMYTEAARSRGRAQAIDARAERKAHLIEDAAWERFLEATERLAASGQDRLARDIQRDALLAATYAARDALSEALAAMKGAA
jgi:hypothetical protein